MTRRRELLFAAYGLSLLTVCVTFPLVLRLQTAFPTTQTDPAFNAWILAWGADRLPHALSGFFHPPFFHPYRNTLAYSETLLGITALVAPVQWLGGNPILTYNIAFMLSYVLAGLGAYLLVRDLTGSAAGAIVAACAFAFSPYRAMQMNHLQVLSIGGLPLSLWGLHRYLARPSLATLILFLAAFAWQGLSNGYSLFFGAVAVAAMIAWHLVYGRPRPWRALAGLAAGGMVAALMLLPMARAFYAIWHGHSEPLTVVVEYSADLATYLKSGAVLRGVGWLPGVDQVEGNLFPGFVASLLALCALIPSRRHRPPADAWLWMVIGILGVLISLGPAPRINGQVVTGFSLFTPLAGYVPFFSIIRVPARFGMLAILAASVLAGYGTSRVVASFSQRARGAITAAAAAAIVVEGLAAPVPMKPPASLPAAERPMYDWLRVQPHAALLELPLGTIGFTRPDLIAQYEMLRHRHPLVNGISRVFTPLMFLLGGGASPFADPATVPEGIAMMRGLGVRYLIVRPAMYFFPANGTATVDVLRTLPETIEAHPFGGAWMFVLRDEPAGTSHGGREIPASAFTATASQESERLPLAFDQNLNTRWLTGRPQQGTEWIALEFDRPRAVARLELLVNPRSMGDYPREIEVASGMRGGAETVLFRGSVLGALGRGILVNPELPAIVVPLEGRTTSRLIVRQRGAASPWYWSVDELRVWEQ